MKRERAIELAGRIADLGLDCTISIAAAHPADGVREECHVQVTPGFGGLPTMVQLFDLVSEFGLDIEFPRHGMKPALPQMQILDTPARQLRSVS
jgi:hypothetical protein